MHGYDAVVWADVGCSVICFLLSFVIVCRKLPVIDRISPMSLQLAFCYLFILSFTHGFPREEFNGMIFALAWALFANINAYRIYRTSMPLTRLFALLEFVQSACTLWLTVLGYISACWRYYGRLVWNP